jgi:DNA-binding winged helix-turn-helix (wHTH) protein
LLLSWCVSVQLPFKGRRHKLMEQAHHVAFGAFRLDLTLGYLWRGEHRTPLRPRTLGMLCYLIEHHGRLVTKAELRQHVWTGTRVTDTVLRVCVEEIRAVWGDSAAALQYLEEEGLPSSHKREVSEPMAPR